MSSFKFLGTHISENLSWSTNTMALVKMAQKRLYFLRVLRKANLSQQHLLSFYRCSTESLVTHDMLVWYGGSSAADIKALQRVVKTAQHIINKQLPALEDIFTSCCLRKSKNILKHTQPITYSNCNHLENATGPSKHAQQQFLPQSHTELKTCQYMQ